MNNILVLGDGLLGSELIKQTNWDFISRKSDNIDITNIFDWSHKLDSYDVIINCIANTDTYSTDKTKHWNVNYKAVSELVDYCNIHNKKLVQISTDYVYTNSSPNASEDDVPVHQETYYAYTKLLADGYIELKSNNYLIIRETHKTYPFPYSNAWINQVGNFDYTHIIANIIIKLVNSDKHGIWNVGTDVKTMYDLALKSNLTVNPIEIPMTDYKVPNNTTMNINKLKKFLNEN